MSPPDWALAAAFWLHMLATVLWVGALAVMAVLFIPIGRKNLNPEAFSGLFDALLRRLDPIAWFSLVSLIATGLIQMTGNPNYDGFFLVNNRWATAILVKHVVFLGMIGVSAYMTWWALPALRHEALRRASSADSPEPVDHRREIRLVQLNFALSIVILALTALARTA